MYCIFIDYVSVDDVWAMPGCSGPPAANTQPRNHSPAAFTRKRKNSNCLEFVDSVSPLRGLVKDMGEPE
jgi:hypothetical protein